MNLTEGLFRDSELARLLEPSAQISAMLQVETALATAQGRLGVIPMEAAERISQTPRQLHVSSDRIAAEAAHTGIPAQAVAEALKSACGRDGDWVHHGVTSQDIQDSALILQLQAELVVLQGRLERLDSVLAARACEQADQPIAARSRFQIAAPTALGAKIAVWRAALPRHLQWLAQLRPRLLNLSLHGAAEIGAALAPRMGEIRHGVAEMLDLGAPDLPWHSCRDGIAELASWLSLLTGSLGKIGVDLILLGQSEVAEIAAGSGGGSSTMPQKSNPAVAEALARI